MMDTRRIKAFEVSRELFKHSDFLVSSLIDLLNSLPDSTTWVGVGHIDERNTNILFFENSEWEEVPLHREVPRFIPSFIRNEDGSVSLVSNGIEE